MIIDANTRVLVPFQLNNIVKKSHPERTPHFLDGESKDHRNKHNISFLKQH